MALADYAEDPAKIYNFPPNKKLQYYTDMAGEAAKSITGSREQWASFLRTAGRLSKYPYNEQLMIFTQRPEATACAEYGLWNNTMRRYVRRGSKGIALVDNSGRRPKLRYVFDVADTGARENSRPVNLWKMTDGHIPAVQDALERAYGISAAGNDLPGQIEKIAGKLAAEYWEDNKGKILDIVDDSFLNGYDEFNVSVSFRRAAETSIKYMLYSRCVEDPEGYFEPEDFLDVFDFNTQAASNVLGTAVSQAASGVFREVERAIRVYDRQKQEELNSRLVTAERGKDDGRADIHAGGGLPDPGHRAGGNGGQAVREVRQDAEELPGRGQPAPIQPPDTDRETVPAPVGGPGHGGRENPEDDGRDAGAGPGTGQNEGPDGLGAAHERAESTGGGNGDRGTYQQLSLFTLFPTEAEQIKAIDGMAAQPEKPLQEAEGEKKPSAFTISEKEIARVMQGGSGFEGGKMRIMALYAQEGDPKKRADYLKKEYGMGGRSWDFSDGSGGYVDYSSKGILIRSYDHNKEQFRRWDAVEKAIGRLVEFGQYLTEREKERYAELEESYALLGGIPLPSPAHAFAPTPDKVYGQYLPILREKVVADEAYRNACKNNDRETALMEGRNAIERAALSIQAPSFMRVYFDVPEYHDRFHEAILTDTYEALIGGADIPVNPDVADMTAQAAQPASESELAAPERFSVIETNGGYAVWDEIREEIYVDRDGVSEEFASEWQAEDYLAQVRKEVSEQEAADWLKAEQAKLPPLEYGVGDRFIVFGGDGNGFSVFALTEVTEDSVSYVFDDMPEQGPVGSDREEFDRGLRSGHIREYDPDIHKTHERQGESPVEPAPGAEAGLMPEAGADGGRDAGIPDEAAGMDKNAAAEPEEEEPRFSVIMTSDAFADPEDAFAVWDSSIDDYYASEDGRVATFPTEMEAAAFLYRLENGGLEQQTEETSAGPESAHPETTGQKPTYQAGDTVYLDSKPFVVEQIGMFDAQLRDPSLPYPIFRAENKERLDEMLRADGRNGQFFSDVQTVTTTPDYEVTVTADEAPVLEGRMAEAGTPTARSVHGNGDVTFSFSEADRDSVNEMPAQLQPQTEQAAGGASRQDENVAGQEPKATESAIYPGEKNGLPFDVVIERVSFGEPEHGEQAQESREPQTGQTREAAGTPQIPAQNFRITDDRLGEGGPKAKFRANMDAIRTMQTLEAENRNATPKEQETLSRYVGWGGLADAFDGKKDAWAAEYAGLKAALTPEEYAAARASTLNAHYTLPTVIKAIYEAVGNMGFEGGNILEPSMGVGNFFGLLPDNMAGSKLYGVELDSVTGRIAQKLYPNADIKVAGFETTDRRDFYDLAVGNVPYGDYKVNDRPYNKLGFSVHNYFFAKALDQVRPGGVVAMLTSRYTMDAKSPDARKYIAQRAELLGAVRLPNNTFKANAGTEVVSDILFLQKRDRPIDIEPDWVHLGQTEDGLAVNSYFIDHPEMVLGELTTESAMYGKYDITVNPIPGADFAGQLKEAVSHISGQYQAAEIDLEELDGEAGASGRDAIPADPDVKNFSYACVDGEVYFRENSIMKPVELSGTAKGRAIGMISLRQVVNELIEYQMQDYPDGEIEAKQRELNAAYDAFYAKYGTINSSANAKVFNEDSSYYLLCSLEDVDEDGKLAGKADMFTKRTIRPERHVTSVDTPSEALAVSIGERGRVDLQLMLELLGTPGDFDRAIGELHGVIFRDPMEASNEDVTKGWHTADDYLSGNVREKLRIARMAAQTDPAFTVNVSALEKAQPKDLEASEIDVRLGATWIRPEYIQQFMQETFETPWRSRRAVQVNYSRNTAEWQISGKTVTGRHDVMAYVTYGTDRANAYRILEDTLNLRDVRIYDMVEDAEGKQKRVLNKKETTLAQQKQQAIKDAFRDWVWRDPRRRQELVQTYNELFNSTRPREYDGSHITFSGMNPDITLREHQRGAIAHVLYGGNTLLAHEVGAGKTFEMAASAMEAKRLGLCQKSLFVVPNHLTLQWASEFLRLYPSAKILVASKKDFETARRKKFCARIATGDYDAVIIGHSQFEKIPVSAERQERILQEQIDEITGAIAETKAMRGENFTIKQLEKTRKSLVAKMEKLRAVERKDDVVTFEQLGVDRLFVDEAHSFKNLFLYTKMRNVAGLSTSEAQKSSDMFMKCQYMDEATGGKGTIFATGTPVSNSMTELYTMMRYLQYGTLQQKGLSHFDCWASTFGETATAIELAPEGNGYRARTRFAKFFNLPELMGMFKEVADVKTADQLRLPVPEAKFETVVVQPSEIQKEMVADLSKRAAAVHGGSVDPSADNMLKITSDGRKIGLDQRLMNPLLPDDPDSKLNACVNNVLRIWEDGKDGKLTQLLFCDLSTPKGDGTFNVYEDIRDKLAAAGVPKEEIAFIHDADTEAKKKELFGKVRSGEVRVLLGSTQKMGAGTNVQDRLVAVHHLDVGWRPADMTQRNGRIIRQGNRNKEVKVFQYVTEGTFDAYLYQTLENKQKFISQIMTSKSPVRSCDDVDEQALSYAEIKALCAGNPKIREKMDLDVDVARLKVLRADHQTKRFRLEDQLLKYYPAEIEAQQGRNRGYEADIRTVAAHPLPEEGFVGMEIGGKNFTEKADAGEAILAACQSHQTTEPEPIGTYRGFKMELSFDSFDKQFYVTLKGEMSHKVGLGTDARGNLTRLDNALANIPDRLEKGQEKLENLRSQQAAARAELEKPFPQEAELAEKSARLAELDAELSMDDGPEQDGEGRDSEAGIDEDFECGESGRGGSDGRPSVLADLKKRSAEIQPDVAKPGKAKEEAL